jgi:hypothetical protein
MYKQLREEIHYTLGCSCKATWKIKALKAEIIIEQLLSFLWNDIGTIYNDVENRLS